MRVPALSSPRARPIIRRRWGEARSTIAVLESSLAAPCSASPRREAVAGGPPGRRRRARRRRGARRAARPSPGGRGGLRRGGIPAPEPSGDLRRRRERAPPGAAGWAVSALGPVPPRASRASSPEWSRASGGSRRALEQVRALRGCRSRPPAGHEEALRSCGEAARYRQSGGPQRLVSVAAGPGWGAWKGWQSAILRRPPPGLRRLWPPRGTRYTALEARLARGGLSRRREGAPAVLRVARKLARAWKRNRGRYEAERNGNGGPRPGPRQKRGQGMAGGIAKGLLLRPRPRPAHPGGAGVPLKLNYPRRPPRPS